MSATAADLLDTAPCGVFSVDVATSRILYANVAAARITARSRETLVGMSVSDLFTVEFEPILAALMNVVSTSESDSPVGANAKLTVASDPRAAIAVSILANSLRTAEGAVTVTMTLHNETERHVREKDLVDARDNAEAAQDDAEAALDRSQDALGASEEARKQAEAERTQVQILASTLQRTLLPPILSAPTGMNVAAHYHPASIDEVGGDFYDVFPLDKQTWGFFLGDVSGKGAGAAAVTSLTRYTLRAAAVFDRNPISVLENLNTVLHHEFHGDDPRFCTVVFGTITPGPDGAKVDLASGGHPPALRITHDAVVDFVDTTGGQLVGALAEPHFASASVTLRPGDVMAFYTDGLTEAIVGPGRTRFDDDGGLESFAAKKGPTTAPKIVDDLTSLLASFGDGLQDDVALLAFEVPRPEPDS
ncbi:MULTISPECIES: SpoIIE family protein phosphatase [unclassified Rhodococcus (in: high G+C Gram-positive bacteria)]|uniref:PP2C family protein-serine/threonine phosphatase n=1 Tax=unclassified Rhodococcus (in: high G+C Gram-positive bacteria) TaxID=192944 RepID=UPI0011EC4BA2|nr:MULTISPECIES: SpoIIE family protein phosphatase [unclassified Rhodococcus (in: high G+C Gram-positive bacteria)]KAA0927964.1 SpoIIE family protein phosphatase [Rhodococcus sp. ANT_H53B]MDI9925550.1 SpoIIE family protein phosphatase [Rhodococcus sp. IEGM 1341]